MSDDAFAAGTRERPLGGRRSGTDNLRALPQILDHALIRPIGRGSYGDVWLARSVLGTYRAVKIIYRHTFKEAHPFEREYNGIQKFEPISRSHDGLVDILQIGRNDPDGYFYYVMELADDAEPGRSNGVLESWSNGPTRTAQHSATPALQNVGSYTPKTIRTEISRRGRLPFEECLQLSLSLTSALGRLHKAGLVHRDIKPSNIIFVNGAPKLADIGLVTDVGEAKSFVGTEGFIPPEGPGTAQADIYSLGKVLYEIATGKDRQSFPEPPTLLEEFADRKQLLELNEIILKACENDPSKRYRSVEEMREELELLQVGKSVRRLRVMERRLAILTRSAWAAGAVALVLGAGFLFAMHEKDQAQQARAHAEDLVGQLELEKAELLFAADNTSAALAYLARCLRESPSNRVAASRLISAMAQRAFPLPVDVVLQHDKPIGSAQFSPDGGRIVTASADGTAKVWDAASGQALLELELGARGLWAAFSPDGSKIVTAVELGTVQLWDAATGRPLGAPWQHSSRVLFADFSPEGDRVVVAAGNNAHIWNVRFGQVVVTGFNHQDEVTCARFSPDGKKIITASFDGKARVWDASSGKTSELTLSNGRRLWTAEISPDGQRALTGGGGSARVYDLRSGQLLAETGKGESEIDWAQFSSDGRRIVTTCQDHSIRIWDASTGRPASESVHVGNPPRFAAFSPDGRRLLTGLGDNRVRLWQVPLQVSAAITLRHGAPVQSVHFSPDGNLLATVDGESAQIWDIRAGRLVTPPLRHAPAGSVRVHFSPDGEWIATGSWDRTARIWSVHSGEPRTDALVHGGPLNSVQFNPDSKQLLTGAYDGEARLWDAQTGRFLKSVKHTNQLTSAQFSPDGRKIVTASLDKTARIWDVRAGKLVCPPLEHKDTVWFAQFSTDGNSIVTASADKTARVWDANTGQARTAPMTHKGVVHHAQFSPDGRWVVTRSPDTTARLWNARTGQPAGEPLQHAGEVLSVTFSPDGQRVLTASNDHAARVWDVLSGQLIAEALRYGGAIHWAEFNPDGTWVATACEDGSARLWEVPIVAAAAPSWLSDLAEGVAGQRFTAERTLVTVPGENLLSLKHRLLDSTHELPREGTMPAGFMVPTRGDTTKVASAESFYAGWVRWFFTDPATRTLAPSGPQTVSGHVDGLLVENTLRSLWEASELAPTNASVLAELARQMIAQDLVDNPRKNGEADWLSRRALSLAPTEPAVMCARSEVLEGTGRIAEALSWIEQAIQCRPQEPDYWNTRARLLAGTNRLEEANQSYSKAIDLAVDRADSPALGTYLSRRWQLLTSMDLPLGVRGRGGPALALSFTGTSGEQALVVHTNTLNAYPLTLEVWFITTETTAGRGLVSKYADTSSDGWSLHITDGRLRAWYFKNPGNYVWDGGAGLDAGPVADGKWHHAALTVDGTGGTLFLDGIVAAHRDWAGIPGAPTSTRPLLLGEYSGTYPPFVGQMDEVRIWNVSRTQAQLQAYMHRHLNGTEPGLVAYYRFDDGGCDYTGHGNTASVRGPTYVRSDAPVSPEAREGSRTLSNRWQLLSPMNLPLGAGGQGGPNLALSFTGKTGEEVLVAHTNALNAYPLTVEVWFITTENTTSRGLVSKYADSSANGWSLHVKDGRLNAWYFKDPTNYVWDGGAGLDAGPIADGKWHHAALTVDATGGTLFLDGVVAARRDWTGMPGAPSNKWPLLLGKYPGTYPPFVGQMDEVRIWNTSRTPAQIQATMRGPLSGTEPGLVAYYRFDDGDYDYTGHGNTASVRGPTYVRSVAPLTP